MDLKLGGRVGFWLLRTLMRKVTSGPGLSPATAELGVGNLESHFGKDVWKRLVGKTVLDYGCGRGAEVVATALRGAKIVYGIEIRDKLLETAQALAAAHGVENKCVFLNIGRQKEAVKALYGHIDCVFSIDSFEHYARPDEILEEIYRLLAPGGHLLIWFGPPWEHPYGCHMRFLRTLPWMHFLFKEETILALRSLYRNDGAKRFEEVEDGLNRMTVARFLRLVQDSRFDLEMFQPVAIKGLTWLVRSPFLREYFTSVVKCVLAKPTAGTSPAS